MQDLNGILMEVQRGIIRTPESVRGSYSDGFHTFNELYEFRKLYNAVLFNEWAESYMSRVTAIENNQIIPENIVLPKYDVHKSIRHNDGELCFGGGWFIVCAMLPTGQITNHYKNEDWDLFKIPAKERAKYLYDNHTAIDVLLRLQSLLSDNFQQ